MNIDLHIPRRGDRLSAAFQAQILAEIRANRILQSPGIRVSRGPHGTHIFVDIPKRAPASAANKGCWRIVAETVEAEGATGTVHYIDRQYYQVGGILQQGSDRTTMESLVEANTPYVAARVSYGTASGELNWYGVQIHGYASLADMIADSLNRHYSVIPLYELKLPEPSGESGQESGESGQEDDTPPPIVVVTDFRAIPVAQAFEMPTEGE